MLEDFEVGESVLIHEGTQVAGIVGVHERAYSVEYFKDGKIVNEVVSKDEVLTNDYESEY